MKSNQISVGDTTLIGQYNNLREDAKKAGDLLAHEQATPNLTLYVEPGNYFIGSTRVKFAGGNSPSFVAPTTNPRIDILTIDSAGALAITQGTEAASPTPPAYPTDKLVICEVYNRVGETAIRNVDTAGQGYIYADIRGQGFSYINNNNQIASGLVVKHGVDETITGAKTFGTIPVLPASNPTTDNQASRKKYVDEVMGNLKTVTAGETINGATLPAPVYQGADSEWYKCDADDAAKLEFGGFAVSNGTDGNPIDIRINNIVSGFSGLTPGVKYYVQNTAGTIGTVPGLYHVLVGTAISATELIILKKQSDLIYPQTLTVSDVFTDKGMGMASEDDGSAIYVVERNNATTGLIIVRYQKDIATGMYLQTHNITYSHSEGIIAYPSCTIVGSYLYVVLRDTTNGMVVKRYNKADLTGVTTITISGTKATGCTASFSDGTNLYVYHSNIPPDRFYKYTVSGTTITYDSSMDYTSADNTTGAVSDGLNVFFINEETNNIQVIRKYAYAGGSVISSVSRILKERAAYPNASPIELIMIKNGILGMCLEYSLHTDIATKGMLIKIIPISAPV